MANLLALSPVAVLLLAALIAIPSFVPRRLGPFISIYAILACLALLQVNARASNPISPLFPAFASAPDLDLGFNFGPPGLLFSTVALLAFLSLRIVERNKSRRQTEIGRLSAMAGAVAFFLAGNWTTMTAAWLLSDLGLLIWSLPKAPAPDSRWSSWRALALSQFGALVFLGAGALVLSAGSSLRFESASLAGVSADLVLLSAWLRSGLFPFQIQVHAKTPTDRNDSLERAALPMLMGTFLIIRALMMMQGDFAFASVLFTLALLGVGATSLLVLGGESPETNHAWTALAIGAPMLLTPFVAILSARTAFVLWLGIGLFNFACIVACAIALNVRSSRVPLRSILWGAAISTAAGVPLTPGFLGRVGLYAAAIHSGEGILVAGLSAATTLLLIPLWITFLRIDHESAGDASLLDYVGLLALLLPMLVEGLAPLFFTSLFGQDVQDAATTSFDILLHPSNIVESLVVLGALFLPPAVAFFIARGRIDMGASDGIVAQRTGNLIDGSALRRGVVALLDSVGIAARQVSALIEQHPLGWILFAAIWVAVWLLNGQGS